MDLINARKIAHIESH